MKRHPITGSITMTQIMLTVLFALSISFLTFAASFAEVPRSEMIAVSAD